MYVHEVFLLLIFFLKKCWCSLVSYGKTISEQLQEH